MIGMHACMHSLMVVVMAGRMGVAIEEKWFCMSITRSAEIFGLGKRCRISYSLYDDDDDDD